MRIILLAAGICLSLFSCDRPSIPPHAAAVQSDSTPAALQPAASSMSLVNKRVSADLVDQLYKGLVEKDQALQALEEQIEKIPTKEKDSVAAYAEYNEKNRSYFRSADMHIGDIEDSLLREKLKTMLRDDSEAYKKTSESWRDLLDQVNLQRTRLEDLHIALKIYKTLPLIRQYRRQHLPDEHPMQTVLHDYKTATDKVSTAIGEK